MKLKRIIACNLTALSALFVLSGCKSKQLDPFDLSKGGYNSEEKTEITFYHTMGGDLRDILDYYIEEFNAIYPNITVKTSSIGNYNDVRDQLSKELSVSSECNVTYCYPDHVALYNLTKRVVPLDDFIDDTEFNLGLTQAQKDDFIDAYYDEGRQFGDGKMYCLPFSKSTEVMYYDATFFAKHQLKVPTTWDEMQTVCEQIKRIDPSSTPLGYDSSSNLFITLCKQYGCDYTSASEPHFGFDNPTSRGFLTTLKDWYSKGYLATKDTYGAYTSSLFTATEGTRCYMCIGSSAGASYQVPGKVNGSYLFDVGITKIPQKDAVNSPAVISQGPSVCILNNENRQEVIASWLLVRFLLTNVSFQASFSQQSGYVPVLKSVYNNQIYARWLANSEGNGSIQAKSVKVCGEQSNYYFSSPAFVGSSEARDQVGTLLTSVITGDKTMDQAFADAIAECNYQAGQ